MVARRSSKAIVILVSPETLAHSLKLRLVVMMMTTGSQGLPDRAFQSLLDIKALMRDATTLLKATSVVWHDNRARCDIII
jgi:hypothetical protein